MNAKRWNTVVLVGSLLLLLAVGGVTLLIDPFLHYHSPLAGLEYPLKDERYQNDGILRNYEYDAVITGTSMCQNFLPSEFDELWGTTAVKVCYSGAGYKEVDENIRRALEYNAEVKYVLRSLDGNRLNYPADYDEYEGYPDYLFDKNPFNDVSYLLNKEVVPKTISVLNYTRSGQTTPDRDAYGFWGQYKTYGKEEVMRTWSAFEEQDKEYRLEQTDYERIEENIRRNILRTAEENPEVIFYLFFPPYSICHWNTMVRTNQLEMQLEAECYAAELLLEADNIRIFHFSDRVDMVGNLDNYTDALHYGPWINSEMLKWMHAGEGELTRENYKDYFRELKEIYEEYDYSDLEQ